MAETKHTRESVNKLLKRTNIKGKDYIDVAQRINGFWEVFPEGRITTEWLVLEQDWCVCQATAWNMDTVLAQGTAYEVKGASNINRTSYVENCETSAIGRALGIAGIGSTDSVASANEVQNAISQQNQQKQPGGELTEAIDRCRKAVKAYAERTGANGAAIWSELTKRDDFENQPAWWVARSLEFELKE